MMLSSMFSHAPQAFFLMLHVGAIAYVRSTNLKALVYATPVPFTCAYLATYDHISINSTHLIGTFVVVGYTWMVYHLHKRAGLPLFASVVCSALSYILISSFLKPLSIVPLHWTALFLCCMWLIGAYFYKPIHEPTHRSTMPWYIKMPIVFTVAMLMFSAVDLLGGAVTTAPYAGVFSSFEARNSLRTFAGRFMFNAIGFAGMIATIGWLEQAGVHLVLRLVIGWAVALVLLWAIHVTKIGILKDETDLEPVPVD